jgi:uncharacterized membrane protein
VNGPRLRLPALLLALGYVTFAACVAWGVRVLPEITATHFGADGVANGWTTRTAHLALHSLTALLLPLGTVALCYATRHFPPYMQNIPRQAYWLAPPRRAWYFRWLLRQALWFALLALAFVGAQLALSIEANLAVRPRLAMAGMWACTAAFLVGTLLWALALVRHLRNAVVPEQAGE